MNFFGQKLIKWFEKKWKAYWTYRKSDWADMWGKVLFNGPSITELITRCYHPKAHGCIRIIANPTMYFVLLVLTWVLVFVVHLNTNTTKIIHQSHSQIKWKWNYTLNSTLHTQPLLCSMYLSPKVFVVSFC